MTGPSAAASSARAELDQWTDDAAQAAERGQWDRVEECYQEREAAMSRVVLSRAQIERLLAVDRRIQAQALVAKTAIAEQLRQSFATRMRLKGLRAGIGAPQSDSGALRTKA